MLGDKLVPLLEFSLQVVCPNEELGVLSSVVHFFKRFKGNKLFLLLGQINQGIFFL